MFHLSIIRTNSENSDFRHLVNILDQYLEEVDGIEHAFYQEFNKLDSLCHVVMAYSSKFPTGCGAFKPYDESTIEVKRMFTDIRYRNKGIATEILNELEAWALDEGYTRCILETGKRMPEAIEFYKKMGYSKIENFGQYKGVANSVCFEKILQS